MNLPSLLAVRQLAQARLRDAVWGAAWCLVLAVVLLATAGLAAAAWIIATAQHIGLIPALLAWSGGLLALALIMILVRQAGRRRQRIRELQRAAANPAPANPLGDIGGLGASMLSNAAFKAGVEARNSISPLAATAAAFAIGVLIAGVRRR